MFRVRLPSSPFQRHFDCAIEVRPEHCRAAFTEPVEGLGRGMAIRVSEPCRNDREGRPHGVEEGSGGGGPAAVVRDLQEVDVRQTTAQQDGIDALLDVAHQEEPVTFDLPEEHNRDVVDARAGIRRAGRNGARVGPQHPKGDGIEGDRVAGLERLGAPNRSEQCGGKRTVAGSWAQHPRFHDAPDPVALQKPGQPGDVVFMGVAQDEQVQPTIPGRQPGVECDEKATRIGTTVDQHSAAAVALDEDRVSLSHIEHVDSDAAAGAMSGDQHEAGDGRGKDECQEPGQAILWQVQVEPRRSR
jgi:hypothetical protein